MTGHIISITIGAIVALTAMVISLKAKTLKRSKAFNLFTWLMFFNVVAEYFIRPISQNLKDLADVWFIFAVGYMFVFEYGEWIDYDQNHR